MFSFLRASAPKPRIDSSRTDAEYKKLRWQVFSGVFIGYAAYYLIRKNFSLAIPYLIDQYGYSKADLGKVSLALSLAYGFSKFIMGNVSDRSNPKYFITIGLVASAAVSLIFGLVPAVLSSLTLMIFLSALNGWFQGWQSLFYLPATIAIILAIIMFYLMKDTPESEGLPPVDEWKGEKIVEKVESAHTLSAKDIFFKYIINNKFLWAIAVANVFVYFVRYGIIDWAPTYLKEVKHFSVDKQSWAYFLYEYAGIFGMLTSGYLSDKVFKGHRAPPMLLFLTGVLVAVFIYWKNPPGNPLVDNICLVAIGFLIYGPVMMIGLQAADLVPRVATGTATGLTGLFGYLLGSASAGYVMGKLVDVFGWNGGFYALIVSCVLAFVFISLTLFKKTSKQLEN